MRGYSSDTTVQEVWPRAVQIKLQTLGAQIDSHNVDFQSSYGVSLRVVF